MRTRWLVLAGAILALQAPALDFIALKFSSQGYLPGPLSVSSMMMWNYTLDPHFVGYYATALFPLLMAFRRLRENRWNQLASVLLFFLLAIFWMVTGSVWQKGNGASSYLCAAVATAGLLNVLGQLCARLPLRVAAGTSRLWLGVLLFGVTLTGWVAWDFNPWLLGAYPGLAGGALVAFGEWRGLFEPAPPESR